MGQLTKYLLLQLREWCEKEYGRKADVARELGLPTQALSNLFANRQQLTGEQALIIVNLLKKHRVRKPKPESDA